MYTYCIIVSHRFSLLPFYREMADPVPFFLLTAVAAAAAVCLSVRMCVNLLDTVSA